MDYLAKMAEETLRIYFEGFVGKMKRLYEPYFLKRRSTDTELSRMLVVYEDAGFPGRAGCICIWLHEYSMEELSALRNMII